MRTARYLSHPEPSDILGLPSPPPPTSSILIKRSNIRPDANLPLRRRLALHIDRLLAAVVLRIVRAAAALAALGARRAAVLAVVVLGAGVDVDLAPAAALVHHVEPRQLVRAQAAARPGRVRVVAAAELIVRATAAVRAAQQGWCVALGEGLE